MYVSADILYIYIHMHYIYIYSYIFEILKDKKGDDELLRKALDRIESLEKQLLSSRAASEAGSVGGDADPEDVKNPKKKDKEEEDPPIITPDGVKVS